MEKLLSIGPHPKKGKKNPTCLKAKMTEFESTSEGNTKSPTTPVKNKKLLQQTTSCLENTNMDSCAKTPPNKMIAFKETLEKKKAPHNKSRQKQFCIFCQTVVSKLSRHVRNNHKHEKGVRNIELFSPRSQKEKLKKLRTLGIVEYNKTAEVKIVSRPSFKDREFVQCPNCDLAYLKEGLKKHVSRCTVKNTSNGTNADLKKNGTLFEKSVLEKMRKDDVFEIISNDKLILQFGESVFNKNQRDVHINHHVASQMRELSKLVVTAVSMKEKSVTITSLAHLLTPKNYDLLVKSIKKLCEYDEKNNTFGIPSLALKLGYHLKSCLSILIVEAIKDEDQDYVTLLERVQCLFDKDFPNVINKRALKTLQEKKWKKKTKLPNTSCIQKLVEHIKTEEQKLIEKATTQKGWKQLASMLLVHAIIFNRRRCGEVARMPLANFVDRHNSGMDDDLQDHILSPMEKKISNTLEIVYVRGKQGHKKVPILFTPHMIKCANVLLEERDGGGEIPASNPYFFAQGDTYIEASAILRKVCSDLNIDNITSTSLRKHVATMAQIMHLDQAQLRKLTDYMGHKINVHLDFYSLSNDIVQKAKLSKLFLCLERGPECIEKFKNKDFDDIEIDDEMYNKILIEEDEEDNDENEDTDADKTYILNEKADDENEDNSVTSSPVRILRMNPRREASKVKKTSEEDEYNTDDTDADKTYSPFNKNTIEHRKKEKKENVTKLKSWNKWGIEETKQIENYFKSFILQNKLPGITDIKNRNIESDRTPEEIRQKLRRLIQNKNKNKN
ncbi:hypothetical protein WDU94_001923 [Cyamophila willieti]